jgi:hypothetical protein
MKTYHGVLQQTLLMKKNQIALLHLTVPGYALFGNPT